jgi:hypothetical protein
MSARKSSIIRPQTATMACGQFQFFFPIASNGLSSLYFQTGNALHGFLGCPSEMSLYPENGAFG